jgi:hypothetical protein
MNAPANFCPSLKSSKLNNKSADKHSHREDRREEYENISAMTHLYMQKK